METLAIVLAILFVGGAVDYGTTKAQGASFYSGLLFFAALAVSIYVAVT